MYLMPAIPFRKGLKIITLVVRSFFPQMPDRALTRKRPVGIKTRLIRVADRAGGPLIRSAARQPCRDRWRLGVDARGGSSTNETQPSSSWPHETM